jgi:hypothetical protein
LPHRKTCCCPVPDRFLSHRSPGDESQSLDAENGLGLLEKYGLKYISPDSVARVAFRDGAL